MCPSVAVGGLDDSAVANSARRNLHDACKRRLAPRPALFVRGHQRSSPHSRKRIPAVGTRSRARNLAHPFTPKAALPACGLVFPLLPTQSFIGWLRNHAPGSASLATAHYRPLTLVCAHVRLCHLFPPLWVLTGSELANLRLLALTASLRLASSSQAHALCVPRLKITPDPIVWDVRVAA